MGFSWLKATEPLQGDSLCFTTNFPEIPGTHLIDLGRMKGSSSLTTRSLLYELYVSLWTKTLNLFSFIFEFRVLRFIPL